MADSDVNDITLYQRFLSGDDSGLQRLMERYGNSLTLYIDGYLHDIHEAEDLMIEAFAYFVAKRPRLRDDGFRANPRAISRFAACKKSGGSSSSASTIWSRSRRAMYCLKRWYRQTSEIEYYGVAWTSSRRPIGKHCI